MELEPASHPPYSEGVYHGHVSLERVLLEVVLSENSTEIFFFFFQDQGEMGGFIRL